MSLLTGALTALTLAGTPGLPAWNDTTLPPPPATKGAGLFTRLMPGGLAGRQYGDFEKNPSPSASKTYSVDFTRLAPSATPTRVYGSFEGKVEKIQDEKNRTDTVRVIVTEGPVSEVELAVTEVLLPRVTEARTVGIGRVVVETIRPRVTEVVQFLEKGGSVPKAGSDGIVPVVTEGSAYRAQIAVTESIVPVITEGSSPQKVDVKVVADTVTAVVSESKTLNISLAVRQFSVTEVITPRVTESTNNRTAGEVDIIRIVERPYGRIRITEA